jgi:hypothetical protein
MAGTAIGLIPSLRELNWFSIPFGVIGVLLSIIVLARTKGKNKRNLIVSLSLCFLAVVIAISVLVMSGEVM